MKAIKLSRKQLECVSHASTDETRQAMHGLLVDNGKAVATDGHRLVEMARVPEEDETQTEHDAFIIPRDVIDGILKIIPKKIPKGCLGDYFHGVTLVFDVPSAITWRALDKNGREAQGEFAAVDGQFPDYKQVIPGDESMKATIALNWAYIADFGKLASNEKSKMVVFSFNKNDPANYAAVLGNENGIDGHVVRGIVMPMRFDGLPGDGVPGKDEVWPTWAREAVPYGS